MEENMKQDIGIYFNSEMSYPTKEYNFRPDTRYPEFQDCAFQEVASERNSVYEGVRNAFLLMEYDKENIGSVKWNPLGEFMKHGDNVLLKPNMVMHYNRSDAGVNCLYTHPSIVATIIDYCILALSENDILYGKITVGDAPMQERNFETLIEESGYKKLIQYYSEKGIKIELVDFRNVRTKNEGGIRIKQAEDKENGVIVQLNEKSNFAEICEERLKNLRITNYDPHILQKHHNINVHEYKVAKEILETDVIINLPKPKTHRKAGVTIAMKNLVGINANKEFLPHHTLGSQEEGGDAYLYKNNCLRMSDYLLDKRNFLMQSEKYSLAKGVNFVARAIGRIGTIFYKKNYREGSWYGNDTIWRTIYDLNKIAFYADKKGVIQEYVSRKMLIVADMVIAGQKDGPVAPSEKFCGVIAIGENPGYFDKTICNLMGFDLEKIPTTAHLHEAGRFPIMKENMGKIVSNYKKWDGKQAGQIPKKDSLQFEANPGWKDVP